MGGVTYESFKDMMAGAMQNMVIYEQGRMAELESKRLKTE